ncbi:MAG: hypothetical protein P8188_04230 [Gemmatimonadota bacterium]|jgi:hypothetical protein
MRRVFSVLLTLSLVAGLVTPRVQAVSGTTPSEVVATVDVEGRGLITFLGCVGCLGGGAAIVMSGSTVLLSALAMEGSAIAAATCAAMCLEVIT